MNTKHIPFSGKYINGKALEELYNFSENKFITKTSPGIGVTTSLLNYTKGNLIIISPLTPMIEKKFNNHNSYASHKQFFKCNGLPGQWSEVIEYLKHTKTDIQNLIINCTPDSICHLYDEDRKLFNQLCQMPIIIDEFDTVVHQSQLRKKCGRFLELMINKWKGSFTLTTATPNYSYLDVPKDKNIVFYSVGREINPLRELNYSTEFMDAYRFIFTELEKGNKVACFTNNLNVHKKEFSEWQKSMAGENLTLKLEYYDVETAKVSSESPFENSNVVIFSGKYFIGYDIEEDISVIIISEANHPAVRIGVNLAVQALHRCRGKVKNALYVNTGLNKLLNPTENQIIAIENRYEVDVNYFTNKANQYNNSWELLDNDPITPELYCNRSQLASDIFNKIYWYELHMPENLSKRFLDFKLKLTTYSSPEIELPNSKPIKFNKRIQNVSTDEIGKLKDRYDKTIQNLYYNNQGSHNTNRAMERITALLIRLIDNDVLSQKLQNPNLKAKDFYDFIDKFLQRNYPQEFLTRNYQRSLECLNQIEKLNFTNKPKIENSLIIHWYLFYAAYKVKKEDFPEDIKRYFFIRKIAADWNILSEFEDDIKQRHLKAFRKVRNVLKQIIGELENDEESKIKSIIKSGYENNEDNHFKKFNVKAIKKSISDSLFYFINPNIKIPIKNNREYNPLTRLPKIYRRLLPFDYLIIDVVSANAQFVDKIIGTKIYADVYSNISRKQNINRDSAKKMYNHILNKHNLKRSEAIDFYKDICGYDLVSSKRLANLTSQVEKGSFYKKMTLEENLIIELYQQQLEVNGIRIHDGIIIAPWDINNSLPLSVNGIRFNISHFSSNNSYQGDTSSINVNSSFL